MATTTTTNTTQHNNNPISQLLSVPYILLSKQKRMERSAKKLHAKMNFDHLPSFSQNEQTATVLPAAVDYDRQTGVGPVPTAQNLIKQQQAFIEAALLGQKSNLVSQTDILNALKRQPTATSAPMML